MKGTAKPGERDQLRLSAKNRSENVMIVDMIRNDLGKCADPGSVIADPLFEISSFPSLVQMTSTVSASGSTSPVDWLSVLFPCASITGAPKRQTMEWITRLETGPRGIYTGCIGGFYGDGVSEFNVAIRSAVINRESGKCRYHSGCGIVWDSDPADEYQESILKTAVLSHQTAPFHLNRNHAGRTRNRNQTLALSPTTPAAFRGRSGGWKWMRSHWTGVSRDLIFRSPEKCGSPFPKPGKLKWNTRIC